MGVMSKDSMSINLTQCQLPREACTEKAAVIECQGPAWVHDKSPDLQPGLRKEKQMCLGLSFGFCQTGWLSQLPNQNMSLLKTDQVFC